MILLAETTRREGEWGRILGIGVFLTDRKDDLDCDYLSLSNRVSSGAGRIVPGYDHTIDLAGSGAKRKGDASSHLTVCLADVVSSGRLCSQVDFPVVGSICASVVFRTYWNAMMVRLSCGDFGLVAIVEGASVLSSRM